MLQGATQILPTEAQDMTSALEIVARVQPNADALLAPGRAPLSYGALVHQMVEIRKALNARGIGRGDRVAVTLENGPEAAVAYLGIAACAIHMPLNPDYTFDEFSTYLALINPTAIVLAYREETPAREAAAILGIQVIDLIVEEGTPAGLFTLAGGKPGLPRSPGLAQSDDIALILMSSGTTAKPKIIPVRHRQWMYGAAARIDRLALTAADKALNAMPLFHGHALFVVLTLLLAGGSIVFMKRFDVNAFLEHLQQSKSTCFFASSAILQAIAAEISTRGSVRVKSNLRFMKSGSSALDPQTIEILEEGFGAPVVDAYANTESVMITSTGLDPAARRPGSVGLPVAGEIAILGENGEFLDPGAEGEIIVRGPCVFDGYLDDPADNEAVFHEGWFRTGDLGTLDKDSYLTITGRIGDVINRGGEKITPLEVDEALKDHPAVQTAATFGFPHPVFGQEVAAVVVLKDGATAEEEDLIRFVRAGLAYFKVPRRIFFVEELPRVAVGKIQRNSLSRMFASQLQQIEDPANRPDGDRSRTPLQTALTAVWKSALNLDDIALDDDFFLLGGDSLMAATLFAEVSAVFGVELPLKAIFDDASTIEGMAHIIGDARIDGAKKTVYSPQSSDVVIMNAGTSSAADLPPLFAVGGTGGHSIGFAHVTRLLGLTQPFFGLDSVGLDGEHEPFTRMDHIAAEHIRRMRSVQPEGPYYLIGACFGGRVVFEMAQQLTRDGEEVGLTILLDPSPPHRGHEERDTVGYQSPECLSWAKATRLFILDRLKLYGQELNDLTWAERLRYIGEKVKIAMEIGRSGDLHRGNATQLYWDAVFRANKIAGRSYVAGPYDGPVALFWSKDRDAGSVHCQYHDDWLALLRNKLMVAEVPGNDSGDMLLPPNVKAVAEYTAAALRLARGQ